MYVFGAHNTYSPGGVSTPQVVCSLTLSTEEDAPLNAVINAITDTANDVLEDIHSHLDPEAVNEAKEAFWSDVAARFTNFSITPKE